VTLLDLDPRVAAFDEAMEAELLVGHVPECGSRLIQFRKEPKVCRLPAGHGGVCGWALSLPPDDGGGR
jgi:hypothetical protein